MILKKYMHNKLRDSAKGQQANGHISRAQPISVSRFAARFPEDPQGPDDLI
jgi:hypothetical protein